MTGRVMLYVQHLLGIGHLKRTDVLARAMVEAGLDVAVVLGGPGVPGIDFARCRQILLPPVRAADESFKVLLDGDGRPIDDGWRDRRARQLLTAFQAFRPHVLVIELFPFGRRPFRFELLPLLEAAHGLKPRPRIVCSVRDVLVQKGNPERIEETMAILNRWFDRIFVHGDASLIPFAASFPRGAELADRLVHTGYVVDRRGREHAQPSGERSSAGSGEVIVSAGGGAAGETLLRTAIAARPISRAAGLPWRVITGINLPDAVYDQLVGAATEGTLIERWRTDLPDLLRTCALSISQAGYNTMMDLLTAGARAVVVPFAAGSESEQTQRALALAALGAVLVVDPCGLSPETLASAVDEGLTLAPRSPSINVSGAETTAGIVVELCRTVADQ
jgi:predicted glycosyltransferase